MMADTDKKRINYNEILLEALRVASPFGVGNIAYEIFRSNIYKENSVENSQISIDSSLSIEMARLLKEIAIAERINNSDVVEIEEYYDDNKSGNAGVGNEGANVNIGIKGSKGTITKRIYKFSGLNVQVDKVYELLSKETEASNE